MITLARRSRGSTSGACTASRPRPCRPPARPYSMRCAASRHQRGSESRRRWPTAMADGGCQVNTRTDVTHPRAHAQGTHAAQGVGAHGLARIDERPRTLAHASRRTERVASHLARSHLTPSHLARSHYAAGRRARGLQSGRQPLAPCGRGGVRWAGQSRRRCGLVAMQSAAAVRAWRPECGCGAVACVMIAFLNDASVKWKL